MLFKRTRWLGPFTVVCAAALVGCGSSSNSSSASSTSSTPARSTPAAVASTSTAPAASGEDPAVAQLVPAAIKSKGTLTVASDASYAPMEFFASNGTTVIGMDADLAHALAATMGLKANVVNETFDGIIPGLAGGKYDIGASAFTDTKAREKVVDFVDYFSAGESFYTKASGGTKITSLTGLCGKTVAVEKGSVEATDAQTQATKCSAAGKPVTVLSFPDQNGANLALSSGRAQLGFADSPVAAYAVKRSAGQFKVVGPTFSTAPYGVAIPRSSGLAPAVLAALKAIMANGTYTKILTKWGVQAGAIRGPAVKLNGATS
jgi:polar amino acid transport system substrate-binding protein